jgi:hypothetical protein
MDRLHFFFSFELPYLRYPRNRRQAGSEGCSQLLTKISLASPTFIVQNDRAGLD